MPLPQYQNPFQQNGWMPPQTDWKKPPPEPDFDLNAMRRAFQTGDMSGTNYRLFSETQPLNALIGSMGSAYSPEKLQAMMQLLQPLFQQQRGVLEGAYGRGMSNASTAGMAQASKMNLSNPYLLQNFQRGQMAGNFAPEFGKLAALQGEMGLDTLGKNYGLDLQRLAMLLDPAKFQEQMTWQQEQQKRPGYAIGAGATKGVFDIASAYAGK